MPHHSQPTIPEPSFIIGDRVVGFHKNRMYRGKVCGFNYKTNMVSISDENKGGTLAHLHVTKCAKEHPTEGESLYAPGDHVLVAPTGWKKRYRLEGYVTAYNLADHTVMVIPDGTWNWGQPKARGPYPVQYVSLCPATRDDPVVPEGWRFSICKDVEQWKVTAWHGEQCNEYTEETAKDALRLVKELPTRPACYRCGAPLWDSGGRVVCSRHWEHYPQPAPAVSRHSPQWHGNRHRYVCEEPLPTVQCRSSYTFPFTVAPEQKQRAAAWHYFLKNIVPALSEVVETTGSDGRRQVEGRWATSNTTAADLFLTGKARKWMRRKHKVTPVRYAYVPPGSVGDRLAHKIALMDPLTGYEPPARTVPWHATEEPIVELYESYVADMQAAGIGPRPYAAWLITYRSAQQRQTA